MVEYVLQLIFNGVFVGSVYVLVALGLTLMFGVLDIPNFAHGQVYAVGAYLTWIAANGVGNFWVALAVGIVGAGVIGVVIERVAFNPIKERGEDTIGYLLVAFAVFEILGGLMEVVWGPGPKGITFPISGSQTIGAITLTNDRLFVIGVTAVLVVALHVLVKTTTFGKAMRAVSQDEEKAQSIGINTAYVAIGTFFLGSALAGFAGGVIGGMQGLNPYMGLNVLLFAFVIIIIGGMGSIPGAIVAGYLLGILNNVLLGYLPTATASILSFAILYVFLIVRPQGLFGQERTV